VEKLRMRVDNVAGPTPSSMEEAQYLDGVVPDSIRNDIESSRDYRFAGTHYPSGATHSRKVSEIPDCSRDGCYDTRCRAWIIPRNIFSLGI
jgi:hypothetical protein